MELLVVAGLVLLEGLDPLVVLVAAGATLHLGDGLQAVLALVVADLGPGQDRQGGIDVKAVVVDGLADDLHVAAELIALTLSRVQALLVIAHHADELVDAAVGRIEPVLDTGSGAGRDGAELLALGDLGLHVLDHVVERGHAGRQIHLVALAEPLGLVDAVAPLPDLVEVIHGRHRLVPLDVELTLGLGLAHTEGFDGLELALGLLDQGADGIGVGEVVVRLVNQLDLGQGIDLALDLLHGGSGQGVDDEQAHQSREHDVDVETAFHDVSS